MSLLTEAMEKCTILDKVKTDDGYGGYKDVYKEGIDFDAAVVVINTIEARVANKQGVKDLYTVTTHKQMNLQYHDVFMRQSDGKIFRVTSDGDDTKTPASASLNMRQVSAEEWTLPA